MLSNRGMAIGCVTYLGGLILVYLSKKCCRCLRVGEAITITRNSFLSIYLSKNSTMLEEVLNALLPLLQSQNLRAQDVLNTCPLRTMAGTGRPESLKNAASVAGFCMGRPKHI